MGHEEAENTLEREHTSQEYIVLPFGAQLPRKAGLKHFTLRC